MSELKPENSESKIIHTTPQKRKIKPLYVILSIALLVFVSLLIGLAYLLGYNNGRNTEIANIELNPQPATTQQAANPTLSQFTKIEGQPAKADPNGSISAGNKTAKHTVTIVEDYVCPYCKQFEETYGQQLQKLAAAGKVKYDTYTVAFLNQDSAKVANASACVFANSNLQTWQKYKTLLYQIQSPSETPGTFTDEALQKAAAKAGAVNPQIASCIKNGTYLPYVDGVTKKAASSQIYSTPTIFIDGLQVKPSEIAQLIQNSGQ